MVQGISGHEGGCVTEVSPDQWNAHAPSALTYDKPANLTSVTFNFELIPSAVRDESGKRRSDGITALLEITPLDGGPAVELFRRDLDPFLRPEGAGLQQATVDLPPGETGWLTFKLDP